MQIRLYLSNKSLKMKKSLEKLCEILIWQKCIEHIRTKQIVSEEWVKCE